MLQEGSCALLTGNSNIERIRHSRQILIEKYMPVVFLLPIMWTSHKAYLLLLLTYISYSAMLFSRMISRLLLLSLLTGFFHFIQVRHPIGMFYDFFSVRAADEVSPNHTHMHMHTQARS